MCVLLAAGVCDRVFHQKIMRFEKGWPFLHDNDNDNDHSFSQLSVQKALGKTDSMFLRVLAWVCNVQR